MSRRAEFEKRIDDVFYSWDIYNPEVKHDVVDVIMTWLTDAFDEGVSAAGRYGHEDYWDSEDNDPYADNPYEDRTEGSHAE